MAGAVLALACSGIGGALAVAQEPPAPPALAGPSEPEPKRPATGRSSPWLAVPLLSSGPKLGTAFGAMGGYLHVFDPGSRVSLFGVNFQYSTTDSVIASALARTSFGADRNRLVVAAGLGKVNNEYDDFLGSGQTLRTSDDLRAFGARYLRRARENWFVGAQALAANYQVFGDSPEDEVILEGVGVTGFRSVALGAVVMHDSRDNQDMPTRGLFLNANNLAYSEALGGADTFQAYRAEARWFWPHGRGHVLALRQFNWLTHDAPRAAQATVALRGYKRGQYLSPYVSTFEAEERLSLGGRWGATVFGGVAVLYGDDAAQGSRRSYPMVGVGLQFVLRPVQRMLANLEYAQGVEGNRGLHLRLRYAW